MSGVHLDSRLLVHVIVLCSCFLALTKRRASKRFTANFSVKTGLGLPERSDDSGLFLGTLEICGPISILSNNKSTSITEAADGRLITHSILVAIAVEPGIDGLVDD